MIQVEICCNSVASACAAKEGGATRIELCRDLECGGLTPTDEEIEYCVKTLGLRTHVLVRPRPGNFCYNDAEMAEIRRSVERCRELGAAAVVVGFLTESGEVDFERTRQIVSMATPMEVTFHRAFDEIKAGPRFSLGQVALAGCTRLLTSGCKPTAIEGAPLIRKLVAERQVRILAGSGVTPQNAAALVLATGVSEIHGSCKCTLPDGTIQTDADEVHQLISALKSL